ncbi:hypothetical protein BU17DRAFT_62987 [Hysterangium stoloniferum]|nr:hypothetical protein BU17DRAFT_62987 [Hysterangium stoloniferum]
MWTLRMNVKIQSMAQPKNEMGIGLGQYACMAKLKLCCMRIASFYPDRTMALSENSIKDEIFSWISSPSFIMDNPDDISVSISSRDNDTNERSVLSGGSSNVEQHTQHAIAEGKRPMRSLSARGPTTTTSLLPSRFGPVPSSSIHAASCLTTTTPNTNCITNPSSKSSLVQVTTPPPHPAMLPYHMHTLSPLIKPVSHTFPILICTSCLSTINLVDCSPIFHALVDSFSSKAYDE